MCMFPQSVSFSRDIITLLSLVASFDRHSHTLASFHFILLFVFELFDSISKTRNTFCGTRYLPHSHVHNERTVPIIMAGCMAHEREGYISTSGLKSDVTIVFLDPDFF